MKSDIELLSWFNMYVSGIKNIDTDFKDGSAFLQFAETLSGVHYPSAKNPVTKEECHRNVTIAFMAILNIFEGLDIDVSADDIVEGDPDKTRMFLDALASDEWEIIDDRPQKPVFDPDTCDLSSYCLEDVILLQSAFRRRLDSMVAHKLKKKRIYRDNVAKEIVETEEHYVNGLKTLVEVYYNQLKWKLDMASATKKDPILTSEELTTIFSNIQTILEFNQKLLQSLKERLDNWSPIQKVGDVFLEMAPFLSVYTQYCNNYETSINAVEKARSKNPQFNAYLTDSNLHLNAGQNYFESLLITPVQRGPRYTLLLKELLSRTAETHPDYQNLQQAIKAVEAKVNSVNTKIRESQAQNEVIAIQSKLVGDDIPDLVSPGRFHVDEGSFKLCNLDSKGKEFESVYLFVFNDCILYSKKLNTTTYKFRNIIPLGSETKLKLIADVGVVQNAFKIISPEGTLALVCHSPESRTEWMEKIEKLQSEMTSKISSKRHQNVEGGLNVTATISGTKTLKDSTGTGYTCYCIQVTPLNGDPPYTVYRRYREFDALWKTMRKKYSAYNIMKLPQKHFIGNLKKDIVESRKIMLETFLEDILLKPAICKSSELFIFLQPSDNYAEPSNLPTKKTAKGMLLQKLGPSSSSPSATRVRSTTESSLKRSDSKGSVEKEDINASLENTRKVFTKKTQNPQHRIGSEFVPVLPPVPLGHSLRSTLNSRPTAERKAGSDIIPKPSGSGRGKGHGQPSALSRRPTAPPSVKPVLPPKPKESTKDDTKPFIPPKPSELLQDEAKPFIPPKPSMDILSPRKKDTPSLPPKPDELRVTEESKPKKTRKKTLPTTSEDDGSPKLRRNVTVQVKKPLSRKYSNLQLPPKPNKS